jgi:hypothetical protein
MAKGDVNIVIEAQDNASFKLEQVAKKTEETVKQIKSVGDTTKKTTDVIGTFANTLDQAGLGSYASQFGNLTDKVAKFSEVMKAGSAGALAFKVGLGAAAFSIGFEIGNAIGKVIFQTEQWTKALEDANNKSKELAQTALASSGQQFTDQRAEIELIRDPETKQAEYQKLFDTLNMNIMGTENAVKRQAKVVQDWQSAWFKFGERGAEAAQAEILLEQDKERLKQLNAQRSEMERLLGVEKDREAIRKMNADVARGNDFINNLKSELELLKAKKEQVNEIAAANATANLSQATLAQQLLDERDALKQKNAEEQEAIKLKEQQIAAAQKVTQDLERQLAVQQAIADAMAAGAGSDAARQGEAAIKRQEQLAMATNDAERERIALLQQQVQVQEEQNKIAQELASTQKELAKAEAQRAEELAKAEADKAKALAGVQLGVSATQSRLLTSGPANRGIDRVAANTEKTVTAIMSLEKRVADLKLTLENPVVMEFATG